MSFHGRLGPELQEIVGKYSQHQEIDGVERCNELAGNGKLALQSQRRKNFIIRLIFERSLTPDAKEDWN